VSGVHRVECPKCGTPCIEQEVTCWQCGAPLRLPPPVEQPSKPQVGNGAPSLADGLIRFDEERPEPSEETAPSGSRMAMTLTGEMAEVGGARSECPTPAESVRQVSPASDRADKPKLAATVGDTQIVAEPMQAVMRLTFCKACGQQNDEGAVECRKCRTPLEVVAAGSVKEIEPLPRAWGFDLLAAAWIILGFAAVYSGWFLVKTDPKHPGTTWADYFWTGIVVCAPGVLIIIRHYFCKLLFWVMTLASALVWAVIGFIWYFVGLHVSENGQIGLDWLALLSVLSAVSYYTVRQNDAFDFGL
jgi:ribosomal protein L40E